MDTCVENIPLYTRVEVHWFEDTVCPAKHEMGMFPCREEESVTSLKLKLENCIIQKGQYTPLSSSVRLAQDGV